MIHLELTQAAAQRDPERGEVLFIHGVYHAAWAWENFLPHFAGQGYSCYAMSLRGHGASEGQELLRAARFGDYLQDVTQIVDRFDRPPILVGHSLGGMLIQKLLEGRAFPAAALISTPTPKTMRRAGPMLAVKYPLHILRYLLTGDPDHIYRDRGLAKRLFFSPGHSDAALDGHLDRLMSQSESRRIILDVSFLQFRKPVEPTPVLVIGGGDDFTLRGGNFEETARLYGTKPVVFEGKPHDMMLEPGWQEVADYIIEWLGSRANMARAG